MAKQTSVLFPTWRALYQLLADQDWLAHPTTGALPNVVFGATRDNLQEAVVVVGTPAVGPTLDTVTNLSIEEGFTLQVRVASEVPGTEIDATIERVGELCDIVQRALRTDAGKLTNAFNGLSPTHPVPGVVSWRLASLRSTAYPTTEGYGGYAELDVLFKTRI